MPDLSDFFHDLPDDQPSVVKPQPSLKEQLTTVQYLRTLEQYKPLCMLADDIGSAGLQASKSIQTLYIYIDDTLPADDSEIDPMLGQAYQVLTRAAQLLFEAETHLYRYVNRLQNEQRLADKMHALAQFKEHAHEDM